MIHKGDQIFPRIEIEEEEKKPAAKERRQKLKTRFPLTISSKQTFG